MREGWTYKKLGDICEVINGFAFKSEKYVDKGIRVMRITNVQKGTIVDNDPKYYPNEEAPNIRQYLLNENDLLMSLTGNVGRVGLLQKELLPAALNQRVACLRIKSNDVLLKYLFHILDSDLFEKDCIFNSSGIAQKNMSTEWLKKYTIPVPPIAEQERIVAELDLLQGIIEKKKEQLKAYDQLAQSIFYTMFGDPIDNPKGWETKKLGQVYKLKSGDGLSAKQFIEGQYPVYGGNGISGYHNSFNMDGDYIIIGRVGAYCGNVRYVSGKFWLTDNAFQLIYDEKEQHPIFIKHLLTVLDLHQYANHAAQPVISNITLKEVKVLFPPLSLQEEFAEKVEAIERQKALVQQSIEETQTMFDYTMDKYFG